MSMPKARAWKVISASQMKEAELSFRKWYFNKILRLPYKRKGHFGFGSVLAARLERHLLAGPDDRLPDGTVVDLYPESYEIHSFGKPTGKYERWDAQLEKPRTEGPLIKELVAEAIEKGYLRRSEDRWVEWELPDVLFVEDVRLMGFGDLAYPADATILDHKSTKNMRYALSKPKMKKDTQLILYAKVMIERFRNEGTPVPPKVTLGHLYFLKDGGVPYGKRVTLKTVTVTPDEIDARFEEIMAHSKEMHRYSKVAPEHWENVPCSGQECARAYGGCPYLTICGGEETVGQYIQRLDMLDSMRTLATSPTPKPEDQTMAGKPSLVERMKAGDFRKPPAAPTPPPVVDEAQGIPTPPPWAKPGCPSCGGSGWNPEKGPCNICVGLNKFDLTTVTITGPGQWEGGEAPAPAPAPEKAQEPAQEPEAPTPVAAPPVKKRSLAALLGKQAGAPAAATPEPEQPAAYPTHPEEPVAVTTPPDAKPGRGRPKGSKNKARGFVLCVGCTVQGGKALDLGVVLEQAGNDLAETTGAPDGYFSMDTWQRRDLLARRADAIVEAYIPKGSVVYVAVRSPDLDHLVIALSPKADHVIHATR
jgi:hypothetical protein